MIIIWQVEHPIMFTVNQRRTIIQYNPIGITLEEAVHIFGPINGVKFFPTHILTRYSFVILIFIVEIREFGHFFIINHFGHKKS